ncbi:MAG: hypothetical protein Q4C54_02090 [Clostridia bacterium]|nr:hypothetical protein [Clostridia bacterium]
MFASAVTESANNLMISKNFILVVLAILLICTGVSSMIRRKPIGFGRSGARYSAQSLKKFSLPYGMALAIIGASFICLCYLPLPLFTAGATTVTAGMLLNFVGIVVGVAIYTNAARKLRGGK